MRDGGVVVEDSPNGGDGSKESVVDAVHAVLEQAEPWPTSKKTHHKERDAASINEVTSQNMQVPDLKEERVLTQATVTWKDSRVRFLELGVLEDKKRKEGAFAFWVVLGAQNTTGSSHRESEEKPQVRKKVNG